MNVPSPPLTPQRGLRRHPEAIRPFQYCATFFEAGSSIATFHLSPSVPYHLAPACQESPASTAGSPPPKFVIFTDGSARLIFSAAAPYSAHVFGTATPCFSKMSLR